MARSTIWVAVGLISVASAYAGCTNDFGVFEPSAATGSGGSAGPGTMTGGGGQGGSAAGCKKVGDCPAPENPCVAATCEDGACGVVDVERGTECIGGGKCDGDGTCAACLENEDCGGAPLKCFDGVCKGCDLDEDCPDTGTVCISRHCNDGVCSTENETGFCDEDGGKVCGDGACVECNDAETDCSGNDNTCDNHLCTCVREGTVPELCQAAGKTCGPAQDNCGVAINCDDGKTDDETDADCGGDATACPTRCPTHGNCVDDGDCVVNNCQSGKCGDDNGTNCSDPSNTCASGLCVDAKCCNTTCTGVCMACDIDDATHDPGTCSPVPQATEDANCGEGKGSCGAGDHCACNGGGQCKRKNGQNCGAGTDCATGHCGTVNTMGTGQNKCGKDFGDTCNDNTECATLSCTGAGTKTCS